MPSIQKTLLTAAALLALSAPAFAQDEGFEDGAWSDEGWRTAIMKGWDVTAGAGAIVKPEFMGSDDYEVKAVPLLDARWNQKLYVNTREGVGYDPLIGENYRVGAGIGYDTGREDDGHIDGLGDVDWSAEANIHAAYGFSPFPLWVEAEYRQDIFNMGHEGWTATGGLKYKQRSGENLAVSVGPTLTYASEDYMKSYFGVTPKQSARSGLPVKDADSGFRDMGIDASATYGITENLLLMGFGGYKRLLGEAEDSPVSESDHQFSAGASLGYKF